MTHPPEAPTNGQDARTGEGAGQHPLSSGLHNNVSPGVRPGEPGSTSFGTPASAGPGTASSTGASSPTGSSPGDPAVDSVAARSEASTADREGRRADGRAEGPAADLDGAKKQGRGLTLQVIIQDAKEFSAQASTNTRYLAIGGIAVVWALAGGDVTKLRRPSMSLAVVAFVLALVSDYLHYSLATKKLVTVIERSAAAGATITSEVPLTRADVPATAWFKWKTRLLIAAYIVLAWAFVMTVFPEVGEAVRRVAAFLTR